MTESNERVSIELIDAGDHKDRVALVLSKVKGLAMAPEQLVRNTPCTVATNVPRETAEPVHSTALSLPAIPQQQYYLNSNRQCCLGESAKPGASLR